MRTSSPLSVALRFANLRRLRQFRRHSLAPVRASVSACGRPTPFHERSESPSPFLFLLSFPFLSLGQCEYNPDVNCDGIIGSADLLSLLTMFSEQSVVMSAPCGGDSVLFWDGYAYDLVEVAGSCWFAENLQSTHYRNGEPIAGPLTDAFWGATTEGAWAVYGEGTSTVYSGSSDEEANLAAYGRLYNFYAVTDERGLCPYGWHVPTEDEWDHLSLTFDGDLESGAALKSSPEDDPPWTGTNVSGFSALPGGKRDDGLGHFSQGETHANFWTSNPSGTLYGKTRLLYTNFGNMSVTTEYLNEGISVRCIKN